MTTDKLISLLKSEDKREYELPVPRSLVNIDIMDAFKRRKSDRKFSSDAMSIQHLANVLWCAVGVNRPKQDMLVNPTTVNLKEVYVYVFLPDGVMLYDAQNHRLKLVVEGDFRNLVAAGQDFAQTAPVSLVLVVDFSKMGKNKDAWRDYGCVDAGIVSQNINLYCAAENLATVTRGTMDHKEIVKLLNLKDGQEPVLNNPVGLKEG